MAGDGCCVCTSNIKLEAPDHLTLRPTLAVTLHWMYNKVTQHGVVEAAEGLETSACGDVDAVESLFCINCKTLFAPDVFQQTILQSTVKVRQDDSIPAKSV